MTRGSATIGHGEVSVVRLRYGLFLYGLLMSALPLVGAWAADPPAFRLPVACRPGQTCFIQNYVDQGREDRPRDYRCGHLTYGGHDGTDFRVPTVPEMESGVAVVASADGTVTGLRDGRPDILKDRIRPEVLEGKEAGNGVVLDHGNGWVTQYSHLRRGSVAVRPGEVVQAGTVLGQIGLSGKTDFPHVEFTVRHEGQAVDPFTGKAPQSGCSQRPSSGLWHPTAREKLTYRRGGLLKAGFAAGKVSRRQVKTGALKRLWPRRTSDALAFWVLTYGLEKGDTERLRLLGPAGTVLAGSERTVAGDRAEHLILIGQRLARDWPQGRYRAEYTLYRRRAGQRHTVVDIQRSLRFPRSRKASE